MLSPKPKATPMFDFDVDPIWIGLGVLVIAGVLARIVWTLVGNW